MQSLFLASVLLVLILHGGQCLSYDPDDYLEVYPDPRDPEVLKGRTPLHFALIMSLGGPLSQFDSSGTVAGVKVALDRINNDSSVLPGYTLHYIFTDAKVWLVVASCVGDRYVAIASYLHSHSLANQFP